MSKTEKIQAQIKKLQVELKEAKATELPFYIIDNKGVVLMKRSESYPKDCAYWEGEKGSKTLMITGDFKKRVLSHSTVSGKGCIRITPLLKDLGYKFDGKSKTWNLDVQVETPAVEAVDVKDSNPLT